MYRPTWTRSMQICRLFVIALLVVCLPLPSAEAAQRAHLVKDIQTTAEQTFFASSPAPVVIDDVSYFLADTTTHGALELWRSDGSASGTRLVTEIGPGREGSGAFYLVAINNTLFFNTASGLWKSDGTAAGTTLLKATEVPVATGLTVFGSELFFFVIPKVPTEKVFRPTVELWKTNGSPAGTTMVQSFTQHSGNIPFNTLLATENYFYFTIEESLWRTDGTTAGTLQLANVVPSNGVVLKNQFLFYHYPTTSLWKSDGTPAGTVPFATNIPYFSNPIAFGDAIYFMQLSALWRSDGTQAGTGLVKELLNEASSSQISVNDLSDGRIPNIPVSPPYTIRGLVATDTRLFVSLSRMGGEDTLWSSDGSAQGTIPIAPVSLIESFAWGNTLLFAARRPDPAQGYNTLDVTLWRSDGTTAGTTFVRDIVPGTINEFIVPFVSIRGVLLMVVANNAQMEVWRSDGTPEGTYQTTTLEPAQTDANPQMLFDLHGRLFFSANQDLSSALWSSDGTEANTLRLATPESNSAINAIVPYKQFAVMRSGSTLTRSDGTLAGTRVFHRTELFGGLLLPVGNTLFFNDSDAEHGTELWKSDATPEGTSLVKDIVPGPEGSIPSNFIDVNGTLFFTVYVNNQEQLWRSDGTEVGTTFIKNVSDFKGANLNGMLIFSTGRELWKSDGSEAGTSFIAPFLASGFGYIPGAYNQIAVFQGAAYFITYEPGDIYTIWKSDGTITGTHPVKAGAKFAALTPAGNTLFVVGYDVEHGAELWKTDGSEAGTVLVSDINPGPRSSTAIDDPQLANINGTLVFAASDGVHGYEPWRSDGTPVGTSMIDDIALGSANANPGNFTLSGSSLFFAANDGTTGRELWAIPFAAKAALDVQLPATIPLPAGQVATLAIPLANAGDQLISSLAFTLELAPDITYIGDTIPVSPTVTGGSRIWKLADLGFLASNEIRLRLQLPQSAPGARYAATFIFSGKTASGETVSVRREAEIVAAQQVFLPVIVR